VVSRKKWLNYSTHAARLELPHSDEPKLTNHMDVASRKRIWVKEG
jgi:hypothetical protein